jgi:thymidylate kinase
MNAQFRVAVEGSDGSGKGSLLERVNKELNRQGLISSIVQTHDGKSEQWRRIKRSDAQLFESGLKFPYEISRYKLKLLTQQTLHRNLEEASTAIVLFDRLWINVLMNDILFGKLMNATQAEINIALNYTRTLQGNFDADMGIFLKVDPDTAYERILNRVKGDKTQLGPHETQEFLHLQSEIYGKVLKDYPIPIEILDANQPLNTVVEDCLAVLVPKLTEFQNQNPYLPIIL